MLFARAVIDARALGQLHENKGNVAKQADISRL